MPIRKISIDEVNRKKHVPGCAGYEDCTCFGMYVSYRDLYELQNNGKDYDAIFRRHGFHKSNCKHAVEYYATSEAQFLELCDDPDRFHAGITCHGETAEKGKWYAVVL